MAHIRKHPVTSRPQVRWRDRSGVERSKTFARATDARAFRAMIEAEASRGELWDRSLSKTPFCEVAAAWLSSKVGLRRSSWVRDESYLRRHVLPFFGERAVGSITRQEVTEWVSALGASGLAAQTVRQCYRIASQVMAEAVESHLIVSSPCQKVALPRVSSSSPALFLTPSEVSRLAAAIEPRFRCLVLVAAYLGLRWGEVAGLLVSAVDLSGAPGGAACERSSQLNSGASGGPAAEGRGAGGSECCGDGAAGGAACERSSLLKSGATAGSDSFGAGGGGGGSAGVCGWSVRSRRSPGAFGMCRSLSRAGAGGA